MRSKKYHPSLLHISNLSLLSNSAHITEVCEQSLFAFILSERWNETTMEQGGPHEGNLEMLSVLVSA